VLTLCNSWLFIGPWNRQKFSRGREIFIFLGVPKHSSILGRQRGRGAARLLLSTIRCWAPWSYWRTALSSSMTLFYWSWVAVGAGQCYYLSAGSLWTIDALTSRHVSAVEAAAAAASVNVSLVPSTDDASLLTRLFFNQMCMLAARLQHAAAAAAAAAAFVTHAETAGGAERSLHNRCLSLQTLQSAASRRTRPTCMLTSLCRALCKPLLV